MIKRQVLLTASLSVILGIMMGILGTAWVWIQTDTAFAQSGATARIESNIVSKVALLEHLRAGRYADAAGQIEAALDKDLMHAADSVREGVSLSADTLSALQTERTARGLSGYEPNSESVGAAVQEVFHVLPQADRNEPESLGSRATPITLEGDVR